MFFCKDMIFKKGQIKKANTNKSSIGFQLNNKKDYSKSIANLTSTFSMISICPTAKGESC